MTILLIHRKPPINQHATANKQNPETTEEVKTKDSSELQIQQPWNCPLYCQSDFFSPPSLISAILIILTEIQGSKERRWERPLLKMYCKINEKSASPFAPSASCSHPQTGADLQQQPELSNPPAFGLRKQPADGWAIKT